MAVTGERMHTVLMRTSFEHFTNYSDFLALFCLVAMMCLSLWPLKELPSVPGGDKLHHFVAYASFALLAVFRREGWSGILLVAIGAITLGGVMEIIQPYVNRHGELEDFIANGAGVMIGITLGMLVRKQARKLSSSENIGA